MQFYQHKYHRVLVEDFLSELRICIIEYVIKQKMWADNG